MKDFVSTVTIPLEEYLQLKNKARRVDEEEWKSERKMFLRALVQGMKTNCANAEHVVRFINDGLRFHESNYRLQYNGTDMDFIKQEK